MGEPVASPGYVSSGETGEALMVIVVVRGPQCLFTIHVHRCCFNAEPASLTAAQHWNSIGSEFVVC